MTLKSVDIAVAKNEAAARAVTGRHEVSPSARAAEEHRLAAQAAKEHWKKKQAEVGDRGTVEVWNRGESSVEVPDVGKTGETIDAQISDNAVRGELKNIDRGLRLLFQKNPQVLIDAGPTVMDPLIKPIADLMAAAPEFQQILKEINAAANPYAEWANFLTQQIDEGVGAGANNFMDAVRTKLSGIVNKEREEAPSVEAARRKKERQEHIHGSLQAEYTSNEGKISANRQRQVEFSDTTTQGSAGKRLVELDGIVRGQKNDHDTLQGELSELQTKETRLVEEKEAAGGTTKKKEIDEKIEPIRNQIKAKQEALDPILKNIRDRDRLQQEKDGIEAEYRNLLGAQDTLEPQIDAAAKEVTRAVDALTKAGAWTAGKEDFAKEFRGIMGDAFKDTMIARLGAEREGITATFTELIDKAGDPHVKAALANLRDSANRWSHWETGRGKLLVNSKERKKFDKDMAREDLKRALEGGPEAFMRKFLSGKINPDHLTDVEKKAYLEGGEQGLLRLHPGYTDPRSPDSAWYANALYQGADVEALVSNKEFMDKVSPKAIGLLIRQSYQNGLISEAMAEQLTDSEWGKSALEEAISLDPKTKQEAEKSGKSIRETIEDYISKHKKRSLLMALLMPFGIYAVGGYVGWQAGKKVFGGGAH
ncbi:MAG: hypothetical protein ACM3IJ_01870 [Candidatus Levyibacteriota bacterium]